MDTTERTPDAVEVIFDTDCAGDDILAILYGALHEHIKLLAVTTCCGASGSVEQADRVALNTLELAGRGDIPVFSGAKKPMNVMSFDEQRAPVHFDQELRPKFGDRLDKFNTPAQPPSGFVQEINASDFLTDAFAKRPGEIDLVATGPLTNVAEALQKSPELAENVRHAYILGGCFHTPGNITPVTEYNIWADPEAAKIVFNSGMPITLVPLDICENNMFASGMLTRDHIADMTNFGGGRIAEFIADKFPIYIDIWREFFGLAGFPMDDIITLALAHDDSICTYSPPVFVDVELEGRLTRGQTVAHFGRQIFKYGTDKPKNVRIAVSLDGKRFMNSFVDAMTQKY